MDYMLLYTYKIDHFQGLADLELVGRHPEAAVPRRAYRAYLLGSGFIRAQLNLPPRRQGHSGSQSDNTEPTSPMEGGWFNSELPNTWRHGLRRQVQSVGPSLPSTVSERFSPAFSAGLSWVTLAHVSAPCSASASLPYKHSEPKQ